MIVGTVNILTSQDDFLLTDTTLVNDTVRIFKSSEDIMTQQQWMIIQNDDENVFTTYIIKNIATGNVLTLDKSSIDRNVEIKSAPFIGNITQFWYISSIISDEDTLYYFLSVYSGLCITVKNNDFSEGREIIQYPYGGSQRNYNYKVKVI